MATPLQISTDISTFNRKPYFPFKSAHPFSFSARQNRNFSSFSFNPNGFKVLASGRNLLIPVGFNSRGFDDGIVFGRLNYDDNYTEKRRRRMVVVSSNQGLKFNGGGGGGGGDDEDKGSKILVNLALAGGLYFLSTTEQFGWIFDAIFKFWLAIVIVTAVGVVALFWWAGKDSVVDSCPNCKTDFQVFKSMLDENYQQCPYCAQPFSVVGNRFVKDPVNQSTTSSQGFNNFSGRSKKGKKSVSVVDIEAEITDVD